MNATTIRIPNGLHRLSRRKVALFRQAVARRRIQELREEKLLHGCLTEVWDESPSPNEVNSGIHLH
jgi:hypothetical protein